jgi:predicted phosphodiesterase
MAVLSQAGKLARATARKFPKAHTQTLAKKLAKEHPKVYKDVSHAYDHVRYARGERGCRAGQRTPKPERTSKPSTPTLSIPDSDAVPVEPVKFKQTGKGGIIADLHIPYHTPEAIQAAVDYLVSNGHTDFLIILGDLLDCYALSTWDKDPEKRDFRGEIIKAQEMLLYLQQHFKHITYKLGNHEHRLERYLMQKAPELLNMNPMMRLQSMLRHKMPERNPDTGMWEEQDGTEIIEPLLDIEFVEEYQLIRAGKLTFLHGHEMPRGLANPVNQARGAFLRTLASTVSAHGHRTSHHAEKDITGKHTSSWSLGCLCELSPRYMPVNKWNHGFGTMTFDGDWFEVESKRIIDGRVV